jgi:RNA polymerase sigma-70 factor, ECF subfamily
MAMTSTEINNIVTRILGGDIDAYETVVLAYQHEVWKVVSAMLFNGQRTEDLVQQTFINAYQHLHRYQLGRDFGVWLKEIARNEVRQELRRRMREDRRLEIYQTHALQIYNASPDSAANNGLELALQRCAQQLSPGSAEVVEMRYQAGRSFTEIAAHLGRTVEATRQHLARIRLVLRECIEKHLAKT